MRSLLFVPADSEKKIAKSVSAGADALILDLEDAVAVARKTIARTMAADFISTLRKETSRPRLIVRINALDTPFWEGDLAEIMPSRPECIMVPKPTAAADVDRVADVMDRLEALHDIPAGSVRIIAIATELPAAVLQMHTFLTVTPRLEALTWGAEDLSALVGSTATREADGHTWTSPYRLARDLVLMAATATGRQAIDTVFTNFRDLEGVAAEARVAARDGFTAKMAIHPDQVAPINAAFTPSDHEISWAREIETLFAENPGAGALSLRGQMIDRPHAVRASRILARAKLANLTT
jgi:citrate lyase subunit beta / citryl-CoA lyase